MKRFVVLGLRSLRRRCYRPPPAPDSRPSDPLDELIDAEGWARGEHTSGEEHSPHAGRSFHVETMTENGMHDVVKVTASNPPGVGAPLAGLSTEELAAVRSVVRAALDLTGHQTGRAVTEVALTEAGPRIVAFRIEHT
ncbi:hypothetical protein KIF24_25645 [Micromonospora sp. Llam7]|uniref:hypothetical protein n=1 Tax=Micromonospora tarapacensis TaxID=2835305 RepID=UPI001C834CFB|nr:hypothetical protein [Micromonospora tarapacensis]MBX7269076.1 hypothetical protein [Micromonospora tarapacensis]